MQIENQKTSFVNFIVAVSLIILSAIFIRLQMLPIDDLPSDADEDVFSAGRAFDILEHLTGEGVAHTVDTEEIGRAHV